MEHGIQQATDDVRGNVKTANDIKKRLMSGEGCMVTVAIVLVILVVIYWVYKLLIAK